MGPFVGVWVHLLCFALWPQYRLQFLPDQVQTSHVSCWWWEEESYWYWVKGQGQLWSPVRGYHALRCPCIWIVPLTIFCLAYVRLKLGCTSQTSPAFKMDQSHSVGYQDFCLSGTCHEGICVLQTCLVIYEKGVYSVYMHCCTFVDHRWKGGFMLFDKFPYLCPFEEGEAYY